MLDGIEMKPVLRGAQVGARTVLRNAEDIDDIAQETVARFMESRGTIQKPFAWGYQVGRRLALRVLRTKTHTTVADGLLAVGAPNQEHAAMLAQVIRHAESACSDDLDRQLLWHVILGGMTIADLARAWEIKPSLARKRIQRLRTRLSATGGAGLSTYS